MYRCIVLLAHVYTVCSYTERCLSYSSCVCLCVHSSATRRYSVRTGEHGDGIFIKNTVCMRLALLAVMITGVLM